MFEYSEKALVIQLPRRTQALYFVWLLMVSIFLQEVMTGNSSGSHPTILWKKLLHLEQNGLIVLLLLTVSMPALQVERPMFGLKVKRNLAF